MRETRKCAHVCVRKRGRVCEIEREKENCVCVSKREGKKKCEKRGRQAKRIEGERREEDRLK